MSQAITATAQRLANPSVQRLANARYEDDGEDGYEPGYNCHHSRPSSEKGEYTCKEKARHYFLSLHEINWFYFSINPKNLLIGRAGTVMVSQIAVSKDPNTYVKFFSCPLETYNTRQPYFPLISYHCMQKSMINNVRVSKIIKFWLRISNNV